MAAPARAAALVLFLLWCAHAEAQEYARVVFLTDPPGAQVYDQFSLLGASGVPVPVGLERYNDSLVTLQFRLDGYAPLTFDCPAEQLYAGRVPASGRPLALQPARLDTALVYFLKHYGLLAGFIGLVLLYAVRTHWHAVRQQAREKVLRTLAAEGETGQFTQTEIGGYRLLDLLGEGGMAAVYRALPLDNPDPTRAVALKLLRREVSQDPEFQSRFRREVKLSDRLVHPAVVRLLDWGEEDGRYFLVLELVEGSSLRSRIIPGGMDPDQVWALLEPLVAGLDFAHRAGVVHRDLKPENVLISRDGSLKIADFGLARSTDTSTLAQTRVTRTGSVLGTPDYMAPEQIQEGALTPAVDQYALGVMIYEMLTGEVPFRGPDIIQVLFAHIGTPPASPGALRPDLSEELCAVVLRMLSKSPNERYSTVAAAAQAFAAALP